MTREAIRPAIYLAVIVASLTAYMLRPSAPPPPELFQIHRLILPLPIGRSAPILIADTAVVTEGGPWVRLSEYEARWR